MTFHRERLIREIGQRLRKLKEHFNYSKGEISRRLGLSKSGYFKNENGIAFPKLDTLFRLKQDFNVSMDWFIFGRGSMFYKEPQPENADDKRAGSPENVTPDVRELLAYMAQDRLLRHEVLVYFYKYKEKKEQPGPEEPQPG